MSDGDALMAIGARRIAIDTELDELVLPADSGQRLRWVADWLSQPPLIFREWGLSRYVDGGLRALFRGPPGTGKTMAAVALARYAARDLWRIDLAAVLSKYIGETEKNLDRAFQAANGTGAILMFDEADALLGKRSEVGDAHDRYANIEVNFLLQRIEAFDGLAILASNRRGEIDPGALGRIDVMVDFPMPDEAAREEIWRKLLGAVKLGAGDGVDPRRLAKQELSGAEILRAVRMAALFAATDDCKLDMARLEAAVAERVAMRAAGKAQKSH